MSVIDFYEARGRIQSKQLQKLGDAISRRLSHLSTEKLFEEYMIYRDSLEDTNAAVEDSANADNLLYLCEIMMEVVSRGLLEDFNERF